MAERSKKIPPKKKVAAPVRVVKKAATKVVKKAAAKRKSQRILGRSTRSVSKC